MQNIWQFFKESSMKEQAASAVANFWIAHENSWVQEFQYLKETIIMQIEILLIGRFSVPVFYKSDDN